MTRPTIGRLRPPRSPAVVEAELGGSLHALAVRRPAVPLVELRLAFPLTTAELVRPARPSVLARTMLAGTDRHDRAGLAVALEQLGATLSCTMGNDQLELSASVLAPNLPSLLELVAEVLSSATYPSDEVRADRERIADETMIALSRPEVVADEALRHRLYGRHPYGTGIPRPATIRRVVAGNLPSLHESLLVPSRGHLVLVGDLLPAQALASAEAALAPWLERRPAGDAIIPEPGEVRLGPLELVNRPGSVQSNIRLGGAAPSRSEPDWPAASLANLIFGGMFASRLVENLRERHGYTYSPRSTVQHRRATSSLFVAAEVATAATAAALVEARYELGRIAIGGVSDAELEAARRYSIGTLTFVTGTQAGLASTLAGLALAGLGPGYLAEHPRAISRAKRSQVDEAAQRYLAPSKLVAVVVGDAEAVASTLTALDAVVAVEPAQ